MPAFMFGTETVSCPPLTVAVVVEMTVGVLTAVNRPELGADSSCTRTWEPSAPSPVTRTEFVPALSTGAPPGPDEPSPTS